MRSQSLILGTKAHDAEEKYEQEHVELEPVTTQEIKDEKKDIEFARENIYSTLTIPFTFPSEMVWCVAYFLVKFLHEEFRPSDKLLLN